MLDALMWLSGWWYTVLVDTTLESPRGLATRADLTCASSRAYLEWTLVRHELVLISCSDRPRFAGNGTRSCTQVMVSTEPS
jgi:hypothetical protein